MEVVLVAALARNRVIGRQGALPWHLPDDLRRFKALTLGGVVVMGRKTFVSIGKPLPRRTNLVLTRSTEVAGCASPDCAVVHEVEAALAVARPHGSLFVIGGGEIYASFLPLATRLELTHVDVELDGDTRFPELDLEAFQLVREELHPADARHPHAFRFASYVRRAPMR
ncbi:MAG: dihydrofolate reductase [Sandaracinaceae bacterium]